MTNRPERTVAGCLIVGAFPAALVLALFVALSSVEVRVSGEKTLPNGHTYYAAIPKKVVSLHESVYTLLRLEDSWQNERHYIVYEGSGDRIGTGPPDCLPPRLDGEDSRPYNLRVCAKVLFSEFVEGDDVFDIDVVRNRNIVFYKGEEYFAVYDAEDKAFLLNLGGFESFQSLMANDFGKWDGLGLTQGLKKGARLRVKAILREHHAGHGL
jgi:hypothetical protein